ncbi:MAG: class I SAM-dependent methyltransferase [Verrucomicrobiae bacterium]|nr:class I SAM-dependent methyltransferase [Verrucomicrobiae bacterium]
MLVRGVPVVLVFTVSAAVLAYEVVLMRVFSIAQWHHFAGMILSVALLGFGLSGTLLALWPERLRRWSGWAALGFAVTAPVGLWVAPRIPFSPLMLVWRPTQVGWLAVVYAVLAVPFTCGALAIGAALARAQLENRVGPMYAANLVGSAAGAVLGWWLCWLPMPVPMNEFKALSKTLEMAGARIVETSFHPLGRVDVVECAALRAAPGLSLNYRGVVPTQPVVFVDGEGGGPLLGDLDQTEYLDWLPSALAFAAVPAAERVLVIGVGGGSELVQAARAGARRITGVELHPHVAALVGETARAVGATIVVGEGRSFLRRRHEPFDVIQISLLDSLATAAGGLTAAGESYLYTVEAFREMWARLSDTGLVCVTRWLRVPPRDELRLFATALEALETAGVASGSNHLMFVRGWSTATLLLRRAPFDAVTVDAVRNRATEMGFTVEFAPVGGDEVADTTTDRSDLSEMLATLASGRHAREEFYRKYLFDVRPRSDARPYFFHFFRWGRLPELWRVLGQQWLPFVEWGYVVVWATLVQAFAGSILLLGLPVLVMRRRGTWRRGTGGTALVYFGALGVGFMMVELALLQRCNLFLGHPMYAAVVTIATMLVAAGAGAWCSARVGTRAPWVGGAVAVVVLVYAMGLDWVFARWMASADAMRLMVAVVLVALPAFGMGMMFPLGLSRLSSDWVPWAWGVNGCFSVLGAALEMVIAMDVGFVTVLGVGSICYAVAAWAYTRLPNFAAVHDNP